MPVSLDSMNWKEFAWTLMNVNTLHAELATVLIHKVNIRIEVGNHVNIIDYFFNVNTLHVELATVSIHRVSIGLEVGNYV